ncbi:hypothetical protein G7B40_007235 [Aetokthonos hydrillicola Thurmond2011]|jgi:hypothetical protein|uniref:Uncharacterized protein n=1 Tax=Aetokthonos hydrillicola Thurmond2011 TaxID=2712845 RepID=A0AAP5M403_9CYAN|nr:hypothetical protein [Aetokthonos hydrillicola]MBO3459291.1 hypothetical protein [Aetokthonos hydrillicola CCALA 1050]MBW4590601.1 hypothetical protein [Aetokthonos hydrillicola CCALA 1050]MDR9894366.1 hypothetical protein [Aetokthonos hydrillicola Thurmond2011]
MLKTTYVETTPSVKRLLNLWALHYKPDLSSLPLYQESFICLFLETASPEGRSKTVAKFKDNLLDINSQMAWIQTKSLHNYIPNVLNFKEAKKITDSAILVYKVLLNIYQNQLLYNSSFVNEISRTEDNLHDNSLTDFRILTIQELADGLQPILIEFQEQHIACNDWHSLGFMTTQLKFTNKLILNQVTPIEKLLLSPYLKFVEEQVAIPWQRVCVAATKHDLNSPALALVEKMLPAAEQIAQNVYNQLVELFPNYMSRSGLLSSPTVAQSSLRDLKMFQAYLWLSVLEQSLAAVEQELVNLCLMVMEKVDVKWEVLQQWNKILMDEVLNQLQPEQRMILLPYTQGMQQAFYKVKP